MPAIHWYTVTTTVRTTVRGAVTASEAAAIAHGAKPTTEFPDVRVVSVTDPVLVSLRVDVEG